MEISQYIRDLLFTHDRVILSDFGAFKAHYISSKIDEKTNTITPPSKDIVFDPEIRKDGGLLRDYMVKQQKISLEDAEKQIAEYVKTIKSKLSAGKKVVFPELGVFSKLKDDKLFFNYTPKENLLVDSYGLTSVELDSAGANRVSETSATQRENVKKSKRRYRGTLIFIIIIAAIVLSGVAIYFLKPEWMDAGRAQVTEWFEDNNEPASGTDETQEDGAGTDESTDEDTQTTDKLETDTADSEYVAPESTDTGVDSGTDEKTEKETEPVKEVNYGNVQMKQPVRGRSYLVVGSLPTPNLAQKEKSRLEAKGITIDIIPAQGNKFRLSAGDFSNYKEATRFYNDFHAKHRKMQPWLWEY
ncbi:MAG: SPOR domain-containing protein [Bacteroidota bacterium]|nr:SPOR domain-containing protein [Bacteroidota bacterium]